ncbi:MAG TPA: hypothetical protein VG796_12755 [Verrucomicrobiales bacterium]|jgi:hypothetical protein|nr:hypothetical protein [Verrucomicrobiales bacterium]
METGSDSRHSESNAPPPARWLIRIAETFADKSREILERLGSGSVTKLGNEYYLIKTDRPPDIHGPDAGMYVQWSIPVEHSWPCCPQEMEGFIEKAAQALWRKFGPRNPQSILMGQLHPGSPLKYYRTLASNLRGRTLQLFPPLRAASAEAQDSLAESLFCLVGSEGLFCGMCSPRRANGFYPGGTKYIRQNTPDTISRAGAKIAEALHYLLLYRAAIPAGCHWLELGASPGGMTSELLARGYRVTAVDRAPLDKRLERHAGLTFLCADAAAFHPPKGMHYDALLSDLNGDARDSMGHVIRAAQHLNPGGMVIFTLKLAGAETPGETITLFQSVVDIAAGAGLSLLARTHLTYNRQEFTLFFRT